MEKYDSSIETQKHTETVGKYIDILCNEFSKATSYAKSIENATLVDLLVCITQNQSLGFYSDEFINISDNSTEYFPIDSSKDEQERVKRNIITALQRRKLLHDKSKLEYPEKEGFDIWTPKLAGSTYGSEEYADFLTNLKVYLKHHYENNRHHPEHFGAKGIQGMNIIDISEMFCDWKAATERHNDGNIFESIKINKKRFKYGISLATVFKNTAEKFFM